MNIHAHVALFSSVLAIGVSGHPHSRSEPGSRQPKRYLKANLRRRSGMVNVLPVLPVNPGNATFQTEDGNATLTFDPAFAVSNCRLPHSSAIEHIFLEHREEGHHRQIL